ncbi:hypothetical protein [Acanthopleuribacter pedis]|uniref:DUF4351 domain-containing protein n=1 Tax=Acanthopleuribacter pedis TaxID=442870 RepID=A0A8J7Q6B2_9BACT|nr:hypothetical protein [Acanthopleuribacter pedis]MBO1317479.1 hypothetical protein [Acanthopleuribacter pedis]
MAVKAHLEALNLGKPSDLQVETKLALIRQLAGRSFDHRRLIALFRFIDTMFDLPDDLNLNFREQLRNEIGGGDMNAEEWLYSESSIQKTLKKMARQEGYVQGREEGREEGIRRGFQQALIQMLTRKYGILPQAVVQRIETADHPRISIWINRAGDTNSLADLFGA